jgi:RNA polymerase sigma-70 factor (ECF subfamily)
MKRSDEELYRLMRKGNQDAFAELYSRREPALYRYALHASGSTAVAEEVANEVFVQLMSATANFDESRGTLESYLYGVARNLVRVVLHQAVRDLPDHYRDVVILCDLEERNYDEVAGLLGCPIGTVRSRLHRARAMLGTRLRWLKAPAVAQGAY